MACLYNCGKPNLVQCLQNRTTLPWGRMCEVSAHDLCGTAGCGSDLALKSLRLQSIEQSGTVDLNTALTLASNTDNLLGLPGNSAPH